MKELLIISTLPRNPLLPPYKLRSCTITRNQASAPTCVTVRAYNTSPPQSSQWLRLQLCLQQLRTPGRRRRTGRGHLRQPLRRRRRSGAAPSASTRGLGSGGGRPTFAGRRQATPCRMSYSGASIRGVLSPPTAALRRNPSHRPRRRAPRRRRPQTLHVHTSCSDDRYLRKYRTYSGD